MKVTKVIFSLFTLICLPFACFSQEVQDTVFLTNGQIITGKIIEKYPNNSLKIKSATGEVYFFRYSDIVGNENIQSADDLPVANSAEEIYQEKYEHLRDSLQKVQQQKALEPKAKPAPLMSKEEFYTIRDKNMQKLMYENDQNIYLNFRTGMKLRYTGRGFTSSGITTSLVGLGVIYLGIASKDPNLFSWGISISVIGEGLILV
jgi:hypothetical protein